MAVYFLCGHGDWSKSGFVSVPKNTSVITYTPMGRYLGTGQAHKIMRGEAGALPALHIVKEWESVADMSLYPAPEFATGDRNAAAAGGIGTFHTVTRETKLSTILRELQGHTLHWMACMARFSSKDTAEGGFNDDYFPSSGIGLTKLTNSADSVVGLNRKGLKP